MIGTFSMILESVSFLKTIKLKTPRPINAPKKENRNPLMLKIFKFVLYYKNEVKHLCNEIHKILYINLKKLQEIQIDSKDMKHFDRLIKDITNFYKISIIFNKIF